MKESKSTKEMKLVTKLSFNCPFLVCHLQSWKKEEECIVQDGGIVVPSSCQHNHHPIIVVVVVICKRVRLLPCLSFYMCRCVSYQAQALKLIYYYLLF